MPLVPESDATPLPGAPAGATETAAISRRALLAGAAGVLGAGVAAPFLAPEAAADQAVAIPPEGRTPGPMPTPLGQRSPFETLRREVNRPTQDGASLTPLQHLDGIITPADVHFERHHAGVPTIDPARYTLLIHGLVERPTIFTLDDLKRFPRRTRHYFLECSGNGTPSFRDIRPDRTPQQIDGMTSTSEWIGVPLATLFHEVGVLPGATWFLAEGADAGLFSRSIPVGKAMDDALVAYGQNGEALRPEQGYPARLFLPGWEGSTSIKWLRRIELADGPFMTRDETSKYTDPAKGGRARQFSLVMDVKSIITAPAHPAVLPGAGGSEIRGIAWSGRGRVTRVDVSTDGGRSWAPAALEEPVLAKCHTRFRFPWQWQGGEAVLMSRATDETGAAQPTLAAFRDARGAGTQYHFNHIRSWRVDPAGRVAFGLAGT